MKLLQILLLFFSIISFAQKNKIDSIKEDYKMVRDIYQDYRQEVNLPNKYFLYTYSDERKNIRRAYLSRKKYDSLTTLKLPDSTIIKESIYKISSGKSKFICLYNSDQKIYSLEKYLNNKLLGIFELNYDASVYTKKDFRNLTLETYYFGETKYPVLYQYYKFKNVPFDLTNNTIYQKIVLQDGTFKIYDYKNDFPISDEIFLKKVPAIFAEQSVELLKDGKKVKNFNKSNAKDIAMHMLGAITKAGDDYKYNYKYELKKGYSEDDPSKPVYSFIFYTPTDQFWGLTIDPKTEKLINVDYGKGMIY